MDEQDRKQEYIVLRKEFKEKKEGLLAKIFWHQNEIVFLKEQIDEKRPRTEHGSLTCDNCDCISMKYIGRTPQGGLSGGDDIYECEICGKSNL